MGLIAAGVGAASGVLRDAWRDYIYCDAMPADILMCKGKKRPGKGKRGNNNLVTSGSIIAVDNGQCMIIVRQGEIVEFCAEPGEFLLAEGEPTILYGKFGKEIRQTFAQIGQRFVFGGEAANDLRVYYFNTREIVGNKFKTTTPIPFRHVDRNLGLETTVRFHCAGEYSYRITNPLVFYKNVTGNAKYDFSRSMIDSQLRDEFLSALPAAFARVSDFGIRFAQLAGHTMDVTDMMSDLLRDSWNERLGIGLVFVSLPHMQANPEDEAFVKDAQMIGMMRDPNMRAAHTAAAAAMAATRNISGINGFDSGAIPGAEYEVVQAPEMEREPTTAQEAVQEAPSRMYNTSALDRLGAPKETRSWFCPSCGTANQGRFCIECGKPEPMGWRCPSCGTTNMGRFCIECGSPRPA